MWAWDIMSTPPLAMRVSRRYSVSWSFSAVTESSSIRSERTWHPSLQKATLVKYANLYSGGAITLVFRGVCLARKYKEYRRDFASFIGMKRSSSSNDTVVSFRPCHQDIAEPLRLTGASNARASSF